MTREQFIACEIVTWGEDYIFDLLDNGYEPIQLVRSVAGQVETKWTWLVPQAGLTNTEPCGTLVSGSDAGVTPVSPAYGASRTNAM